LRVLHTLKINKGVLDNRLISDHSRQKN